MEEKEKYPILDKKYEIIKKLDEGGFAKVYLGKKMDTEEYYAIKFLKKDKISLIEINTFLKEIEILKYLYNKDKTNKYVPHIYDSGKIDFKNIGENNNAINYYYVTEYFPNKTLFEYIFVKEKGFSEKFAKVIFKKILKGVKYCHDNGIYHLDLHFKNIIFDKDYEPKIIDFGLSLESKNLDKSGYFMNNLYTGRPVCPEHFEKKKFKGSEVDVFYLGFSLFYLVTKQPGWYINLNIKKNNPYNFIAKEKYDEYWKFFKQSNNLSNEFKNLYISMVSNNPQKRPNIDEILNDPWMNEINELNKEEYDKLELEVKEEFCRLNSLIEKNNETFKHSDKKDDENNGNNENNGNKEDSGNKKLYFDYGLVPNYIYQKGLNAKNYIIIEGNLNPTKFMNNLLNRIYDEYYEICHIEPNKYKLKAKIIFENKEEDDDDDDEESNEDLENINNKDCEICIKLFELINEGYELNFIRKKGELEEYYFYFNKIKEIIRKILD